MSIAIRQSVGDKKNSVDESFFQYNQKIESKSAEDRLLEFAETQIDKMQKYTSLGNPQGSPGWFELNNALMDYNRVQTSLIGLDVVAKQEAYKADEVLKDKQAEWYLEARTTLNPPTLSAQKWYSSSEIEAYVRVHHREELHTLSQEANAANAKVAAIRRLLDAWQQYALVLNRLSKNLETETLSFANESRIQGV